MSVRQVLKDAGMKKENIDDADFVGGSTHLLRAEYSLPPSPLPSKWSGRPVIEVTHKGEKTQFTLEEISAMALGEIRKPLGLTSARRSPTPSSLSPSIATPLSFRTSVPSPVSTSSPISNQFTAAADAYDLNKKNTRGADDCHLVAYDLGRETFVASFLPFDDGAFEVLATGSDTHLRQPHHRVHDQAARGKGRYRRFKNYHTLGKLKRQVEKAKRTVSCQLEKLDNKLFRKTLKSVEQVSKDASMTKEDVDEPPLSAARLVSPRPDLSSKTSSTTRNPQMKPNTSDAVAWGAAPRGGSTAVLPLV
ncbi:hypothetical protein M407DRAFT_26898 [Tulasnella calospora MUT 4182]|uniref:Uncharacterized protein n=1 Tax=Tulasnella calospora MUT 4182 TaxID=1051891 RepID=A0A0C3QET5_9AGAM|nr:hypothetical protein M407DRAFT_26898 [Tulasnella calospora MUT 4182]